MAASGVAASQQVVKAGWMQRESDILKRWKVCYCVLNTSGLLTFYTNETQMEPQGHMNLARDCFAVKAGREVSGVVSPPGRTVDCLFEIRTSQASTIFCADSHDDAQIWKLVCDDVIKACRAPTPQVVPPTVMNPQPPVYMQGPIPPPANGVAPPPAYCVAPAYGVAPPPVYTVNQPPVQPVTVVMPGSSSRMTSTTYYPNGQTVIVRGAGAPASYPVQRTVYSYPNQTMFSTGTGTTTTTYQVPTQQTTRVYQTRYY